MTYVYSSYAAILADNHPDLEAIRLWVITKHPHAEITMNTQSLTVRGLSKLHLECMYSLGEPETHGDGGVITVGRFEDDRLARFS